MFLSRSDKSSTSDHFYLPQNQNIFGDGFEKNVKNGKRCETVFSYVVAVLHQDGSCGFKKIYIHISHGIDKKNACEIRNLYFLCTLRKYCKDLNYK